MAKPVNPPVVFAEPSWFGDLDIQLITVGDRINLISAIDQLDENSLVYNAVVKEAPWERVLIAPKEKVYIHVLNTMGMTSMPSAKVLSNYKVDPTDYVIDRSVFLKY